MRDDLVKDQFKYTNNLGKLLDQVECSPYKPDEKNRKYISSIDIINGKI